MAPPFLICRHSEAGFLYLGAGFRVQYFLALLKREVGPPEKGRSREWCSFDEALERLRFKNTLKLLRKAWKRLPRDKN